MTCQHLSDRKVLRMIRDGGLSDCRNFSLQLPVKRALDGSRIDGDICCCELSFFFPPLWLQSWGILKGGAVWGSDIFSSMQGSTLLSIRLHAQLRWATVTAGLGHLIGLLLRYTSIGGELIYWHKYVRLSHKRWCYAFLASQYFFFYNNWYPKCSIPLYL